MIDENELAKELVNTLDMDKVKPLNIRPAPLGPSTPTGIAKMVQAATDEDTERASRTMDEQMDKAIDSLEREITEAEQVRLTIVKRITNLNKTREACLGAKEILNGVHT